MLHAAVDGVMGTRLDIVLLGVGEADGVAMCRRNLQRVEDIEKACSKFLPDSFTTLVNRAEPLSVVEVSPLFADMLLVAGHYRDMTLGAFDVTLGQGYGFTFAAPCQLVIPSSGLSVDFGGMAKGYALGGMIDSLRRDGITDAFVSFGGSSIAAIGSHPAGDGWQVSVSDPYTGRQLRSVTLRDSSMSTSGNTPGYNGHIVSPFTGRAVTGNRLSAVVAASACDAEVLSTAWLVADEKLRAAILANFNDITDEFVYN